MFLILKTIADDTVVINSKQIVMFNPAHKANNTTKIYLVASDVVSVTVKATTQQIIDHLNTETTCRDIKPEK